MALFANLCLNVEFLTSENLPSFNSSSFSRLQQNNGAQQLASEATVYIMLEDVNDEIPLFTEREQETVLEGEPIGTKVTQVNAIDKDGTFPNNQVSDELFIYLVKARMNPDSLSLNWFLKKALMTPAEPQATLNQFIIMKSMRWAAHNPITAINLQFKQFIKKW